MAVFPLFCLYCLIKNKTSLDQPAVKFRFGFFYIGYKPDLFYWEFVIMYRKIFMICLSMINNSAILCKGILVLFLNTYCLIFQTRHQPFIDRRLNNLEGLAIRVSVFTIYGGIFYIQNSFGDIIQLIIFIFIVGINFFFTLVWMRSVILFTLKRFSKNKLLMKMTLIFNNIAHIIEGSILSNSIFNLLKVY